MVIAVLPLKLWKQIYKWFWFFTLNQGFIELLWIFFSFSSLIFICSESALHCLVILLLTTLCKADICIFKLILITVQLLMVNKFMFINRFKIPFIGRMKVWLIAIPFCIKLLILIAIEWEGTVVKIFRKIVWSLNWLSIRDETFLGLFWNIVVLFLMACVRSIIYFK